MNSVSALWFIDELFGTKEPDDLILIWQYPSKKTHRFQSIEDAANLIESNLDKQIDYYIGCGLQDIQHKNKPGRGLASDVVAIPGFWIDIDFGVNGHKPGKLLPPTIDDALLLVLGNGFDPTMIVNSGNGIHAWWLFKEVWKFANDAERQMASDISRRLQETIQYNASKLGWAVDSTMDLSRVLRPVGTKNWKDSSNPKPVTLHQYSQIRYSDAGEIDRFLMQETELSCLSVNQKQPPVSKQQRDEIVGDGLTISENADPDYDMINQLCCLDVKFAGSWNKRRTDMKDQTNSSYHMSIANICAQNGLNPQEIADIIVAWQRRHGQDMAKVLRPKYIADTVCKAMSRTNLDLCEQPVKPEGTKKEHGSKEKAGSSDDDNRKRLKQITGIDIIRVKKYAQEIGAQYVMETTSGNITFKTVSQLTTLGTFKNTVFEALNVYPQIAPSVWPGAINIIGKLTVDIEVGTDSTLEGRIGTWLTYYLYSKFPCDIEYSIKNQECPFIHNDHWYIFPIKFRLFTYNTFANVEPVSKMYLDLKIIGAEQQIFKITDPDNPSKRMTKKPWKIPASIVKPPAVSAVIPSSCELSDEIIDDSQTVH